MCLSVLYIINLCWYLWLKSSTTGFTLVFPYLLICNFFLCQWEIWTPSSIIIYLLVFSPSIEVNHFQSFWHIVRNKLINQSTVFTSVLFVFHFIASTQGTSFQSYLGQFPSYIRNTIRLICRSLHFIPESPKTLVDVFVFA